MSKPKIETGRIERRTTSHKVEVRMEGKGEESRKVIGYAAKFDEESELLGWDWVETIEKGAFDDVLGDDVRALFNHDNNLILARSAAGTLTLSVDDIGLKYEYETPDVTYANDLLVNIRLGNINQSSFGFTVEEAEWVKIETDDNFTKWVRHIKKVKRLFDVSPVTFPAYSTTEVSVRSFTDFKDKNSVSPPTDNQDKKTARERQLYLLERSLL